MACLGERKGEVGIYTCVLRVGWMERNGVLLGVVTHRSVSEGEISLGM